MARASQLAKAKKKAQTPWLPVPENLWIPGADGVRRVIRLGSVQILKKHSNMSKVASKGHWGVKCPHSLKAWEHQSLITLGPISLL